MYGYDELIDILPEQILQKVTETEIFEMVLGEEIILDSNVRYVSPFRQDKSPGCRFETQEDGTLIFVDFGDPTGKTHRNCFNAVMDKYGCSFNTSLRIILANFGLSQDQADYEPVHINRKIIEEAPVPTIITCDYKGMEKRDRKYWSSFLITPDQLEEDKTFNVFRVTINSRKGKKSFQPFGLCYAFTGFKSGHVKLLQPYNDPKYKWITNCDENDIGNIENIPLVGEELIIQKSYKDHRVLRNADFGLNVVWTMNEGCVPDPRILLDLTQRFNLITIFYDNDEAGIEAASKLMGVFLLVNPQAKVRMVYLPRRKFPHKDPAAFVSKEGRKDLQEVLKYIGIKPKK